MFPIFLFDGRYLYSVLINHLFKLMLTLLEILLHLLLINTSTTYTTSEIQALQNQNSQIITNVQSDPYLMNNIDQTYGQQATQVVILDDREDP
jgi:hypothetical protein